MTEIIAYFLEFSFSGTIIKKHKFRKNAILWTFFQFYRFQIKIDAASKIKADDFDIYGEDEINPVGGMDSGEPRDYTDMWMIEYKYF